MPKIVDAIEQRNRITEAAIRVIGTAGLDKLRLVDVARATDATTGTIAHYFDGKDALLSAALERVAERLIAAIETPSDRDLIEDAAAVLPSDERSRADWRVWLSFWGRAIANPALADVNNRYYARMRELLARAIQRRQARREIDPALDPGDAADAVITAVDGLGVRAALAPDDWPPERQQAMMNTILAPLLAPRAIKRQTRRKT
jgi:TetR/AcrR family transcriptional regulator, transcriptional repressor of bet genes